MDEHSPQYHSSPLNTQTLSDKTQSIQLDSDTTASQNTACILPSGHQPECSNYSCEIEENLSQIRVLDPCEVPSSFTGRKQKTRKPRRRPVEWSPEMTSVLLRELVQAIRTGKRSDNGLKIEVWDEIAETVLLIAGPGAPVTGERCQGKLETLKKKWKMWTRLKDLSSFGVDLKTGAVTAPDEVWEEEIKKQPGIREFRDKPLANAIELAEITEGVQATGGHAIYPDNTKLQQMTIPSPLRSDLATQADPEQTNPDTSPHQHKWRRLAPLGHIRQPPRSVSEWLITAVEGMATTPITIAVSQSVVQQAVSKLQQKYKGRPGWSTQDIVTGYELFENPVKAEVFLALEEGEDQELWLRGQIVRYKA